MHAYEKDWQRLPLEGTHNTRELGGYPTKDGGQTAWHRFVRSDVLDQLTNADVEFLRGYGVRMVIDLRGPSEVQNPPDRSLGPDVAYRNITLADFNAADADDLSKNLLEGEVVPGDLYLVILRNRDAVAKVMRTILEAPADSCVLFHCQAGKDRTGLLSMLLLSLAGVDRQDCINNYAQTRENLMRSTWYPEQLAHAGKFRDVLDSLPETMAYVYDHLQERYASTEGYLRACGLSTAELAGLRSRLLD